MQRDDLNAEWFILTRETLPGLAPQREWPVNEEHNFQRILLDNAVGAKWDDEIPAPAYDHVPDQVLRDAIALGKAAIAGTEDLAVLNENSLAWRVTP